MAGTTGLKDKDGNTITLLTPPGRASFHNVFKMSTYKGKSNYNLKLLFAHEDDMTPADKKRLATLKKAVKACAKARWGDDIPKKMWDPIRDQGEQEYDGYEEGSLYINTKKKDEPGPRVVYADGKTDIKDETHFYNGGWARASVTLYASGGPGTEYKPSVAFGLSNVIKVEVDGEPGDPFSNRTDPETDFESVADPDADIGGGEALDFDDNVSDDDGDDLGFGLGD